jgi:transposase
MFKDAKDYDRKLNGLHTRKKGQGKGIKHIHKHKLFEGKTYYEWADILEVSVNTIQKRMNRLGKPFWNGDRNYKGNGFKHPRVPPYEGKTQDEWADILGITNNTIRKRLNEYGHPFGKKVCKQMGLKLKNKV